MRSPVSEVWNSAMIFWALKGLAVPRLQPATHTQSPCLSSTWLHFSLLSLVVVLRSWHLQDTGSPLELRLASLSPTVSWGFFRDSDSAIGAKPKSPSAALHSWGFHCKCASTNGFLASLQGLPTRHMVPSLSRSLMPSKLVLCCQAWLEAQHWPLLEHSFCELTLRKDCPDGFTSRKPVSY